MKCVCEGNIHEMMLRKCSRKRFTSNRVDLILLPPTVKTSKKEKAYSNSNTTYKYPLQAYSIHHTILLDSYGNINQKVNNHIKYCTLISKFRDMIKIKIFHDYVIYNICVAHTSKAKRTMLLIIA